MFSIHPLPRAAFSYRDDPDVPELDDRFWHVVMDEHCGLCARTASRIARLDKDDKIRIVPIGSQLGQSLLRHYGLDPQDPQSWLLLRDGLAFDGLSAVMKLFPSLSALYLPVLISAVLPRSWRDTLYRMVARNRYRWFGRANLCAVADVHVQRKLVSTRTGPKDGAGP